jgi:hypothetical protein
MLAWKQGLDHCANALPFGLSVSIVRGEDWKAPQSNNKKTKASLFRRRRPMKQLVPLLSLALCTTACLGEETNVTLPADGPGDLQSMKRDVAYEVASLLNDPGFRGALAQRFDAGQDSVKLTEALAAAADGTLSDEVTEAAQHIALLDYQIRASKGIEDYASSLLEVRLIRPASGVATLDWDTIPVAYLPGGDEDEWTEIQAFDARGNTIVLDAATQPDVPVLVAGIDARADLEAGIAYINAELVRRGLQAPIDPALVTTASTETSKLDYVRLNDDKEPWLSGAAEVYALVSGVDFDSAHAQIQAVDMPYLDNDGSNYYPNQILIFWENYRFAAANVQLYEHDDSTNYQSLVQALVSAVEAVLNFTAPEYAIIARIANEIIAAMPSGWFANDDDYVDSFYTLEKGRTYSNLGGAGGNAHISLTPYILQSN